jgi:pimeloyl-ACP methyl ester carboxylesterase
MREISRVLYPFESNYMNVNGHQYHYIEEGTGEPVVLLHGNPSWSFYYRKLIPKLSGRFHCIAPDHIGMGYSDKPSDKDYQYTLEQRVKDLDSFLEAKGISKNVTLILHDWGGVIGMSYARKYPDRIKKIVLLNTAAFLLPETRKLPLMLKLLRTAPGAFAVRAFNAFSAGATHTGVTRSKMPKEVRRAYTAPYNNWKNRIGTLRFIQDIPLQKGDSGYDYFEDLQNHLHLFKTTPVLIAWGLKDVVFDEHILNKWNDYLPHAEVYRFEDCGHYILEDAQDEVGKLIVDFLAI